MTALDRYRSWFYAATVYNLAWGSMVVIWPGAFFRFIGTTPPGNLAIWQALGMMVMVFAPAYWWVARNPVQHRHLVLIGMLGKLLGPLGFLWAIDTHALPVAFGLTILSNDCLWWPAFGMFLRDAARLSGGWRFFLAGL